MKNKLRNIPITAVLFVFFMSMTSHAIAVALMEIRMARHDDFSRIVFEFKDDVPYQLSSDHGSGHISIIFDGATSNIPAPIIKENSVCIDDLAISQQNNHVTVDITISATSFHLNPFTIKDPFRMVLDISCLKDADVAPALSRPEPEQIIPLKQPDIAFADTPVEKPEPGIVMKGLTSATSDIQTSPSSEAAEFQKYLIVILAILSLIIIILAGIIIFRYRAAPEKSLQDSSAKKLKHSQDMLSSIDEKIREKLRTDGRY
jgi:hypothetical protein